MRIEAVVLRHFVRLVIAKQSNEVPYTRYAHIMLRFYAHVMLATITLYQLALDQSRNCLPPEGIIFFQASVPKLSSP